MQCHICNKSTLMFQNNKTDILFYHCQECEYIFKDPSLYQDIYMQKERYDLHENSENSKGYRAYFQRFLDFLLPSIKQVETALDFGCGESSLLASMLYEKGIVCDYYDPIYHPNTLKSDKKYDIIVSTEVFEHLHQPKEVFESLLNRLEINGYLAIQTEFHPNNSHDFKKWYYHQDPTHIVFFTNRTFKKLCEQYRYKFIKDNGKNMVLIQKSKI